MTQRPINFRAWDGKKMHSDGVVFIFKKGNDSVYPSNEWDDYSGPDFLNNPVVMQFTGLLDKSGKEIYEGDIVHDEADEENYQVHFDGGGFWLKERDNEVGWPQLDEVKVIGNIYENPSLTSNKP